MDGGGGVCVCGGGRGWRLEVSESSLDRVSTLDSSLESGLWSLLVSSLAPVRGQ